MAHWLLEQTQFLADPLVVLWEIMQCFRKWRKKMRKRKWAGIPINALEREKVLDVFTVTSNASLKQMTGIKTKPV